jgi:hypothetical protein
MQFRSVLYQDSQPASPLPAHSDAVVKLFSAFVSLETGTIKSWPNLEDTAPTKAGQSDHRPQEEASQPVPTSPI